MSARSRTVQWDPTAGYTAGETGLDWLQAMAAGSRARPPVSLLLGIGQPTVEAGRVRMPMTPAEHLYNPLGSVHGGVIATLLDTVMACAVQSALPAGRICTTMEIKVNYLRALTEAVGEVVGEGTVVTAGRRVGVAEGRITDAKGRVIATGSTTLLLLDAPEASDPVITGGTWTACWDDPAAITQARLSGLDLLLAMQEGRLPPPPVIALLGIRMASAAHGEVSMTIEPGERLYNPSGAVHGGMIATLLDSVMGCAVHSTLPVGRGYTTLEIKVNYLRAMTAGSGLITGTGLLVHAGRQMAVAEGRATDVSGKLYATASTTCLLFDLPK